MSNWAHYFCLIGERQASQFVDLDAAAKDVMARSPELVMAFVQLKDPGEDGLNKPEEVDDLYALENAFQSFVDQDDSVTYVGRSTGRGRRDFVFYAADGAEAAQELDRLVVEAGYAREVRHCAEPDWSTYFEFLCPSAREMQGIQNARVLDSLEENGDDHDVSRDVTHWVYFPERKMRRMYRKRAEAMGYRRMDQNSKGEAPNKFGLSLVKASTMHKGEIDEATLALFDLAAEIGCDYDGWETSVEKS